MDFSAYQEAIQTSQPVLPEGKVDQVVGLIVEGYGPQMSVGAVCDLVTTQGRRIPAEVVGFKEKRMLLMPYGEMQGIQLGCRIVPRQQQPLAPVGDAYLGRVIDGLGQPMDDKGPIPATDMYPLYADVVNALHRRSVNQVSDVGVRVINSFITVGQGQRVAIMAGSGVGKSVLMGMISRHMASDVCIVALIGERGREVKDFVDEILGPDGMGRSIVVAATSDTSPLVRMRGAYLATTLAEYFRDQGKNVILMMDSVTRFAMSSRDVGLAAGEPPTVKGYTPSFFVKLPKLLERAGSVQGKGSITGIYTVLVEGDDMNDPVGDAVRSIVDGHIVLSRKLANQGHYPAVDVLASVSRVMRATVSAEHTRMAQRFREVLAAYQNVEDLISIGAYVDGSDPDVDYAKSMIGKMKQFLRQDMMEGVSYEECVQQLTALFGTVEKTKKK
ncbi:flagellum-specific ATP synthase [Desulfatibacillum alkenivorans DSM 16219]|jgi:flagellum-specific ATP synthase|uniref:Flagellum-specific ATP synthase n=1 Tax=Desulfatibacillum alkenivorans DSM 16219 TaxID=1121393 RepID=A0A1M6V3N7_9BACT|nr:FliI/YscN family ATPase [Desulfatibacillum alkenivorans]SHK76060.1 flagellum-specific ATP synthase [Desulfatibacillum alkenivorans DSM 16219]